MRPITFPGGLPFGDVEAQIEWLSNAIRNIERASNENDIVTIAQAFTISAAFTNTRTLDPSAATLAHVRTVLATLISDMQKGGAFRTT